MPQTETKSRPSLPVIEQALWGLLFLGVVAMLSLPEARSASVALGWMPLWLAGLPAAALATSVLLRWARGFEPAPSLLRVRRPRSPGAVATRRAGMVARRLRLPRAA